MIPSARRSGTRETPSHQHVGAPPVPLPHSPIRVIVSRIIHAPPIKQPGPLPFVTHPLV
jgi:hypothetical protein